MYKFSVTVHVIVKSATTGYAVANASVIFVLGIFVLIFKVNLYDFLSGLDETSYTNGEGIASFSVRLVNPEGKKVKKKTFSLLCVAVLLLV